MGYPNGLEHAPMLLLLHTFQKAVARCCTTAHSTVMSQIVPWTASMSCSGMESMPQLQRLSAIS